MEEIIVFMAIFAASVYLAYKYLIPLFRVNTNGADSGACGDECGCAPAAKTTPDRLHAGFRGRP